MHVTYRVYRLGAVISYFLSTVSPNALHYRGLHPPMKKYTERKFFIFLGFDERLHFTGRVHHFPGKSWNKLVQIHLI